MFGCCKCSIDDVTSVFSRERDKDSAAMTFVQKKSSEVTHPEQNKHSRSHSKVDNKVQR